MTLHFSCWPSYTISQQPLPQQKTLQSQTEAFVTTHPLEIFSITPEAFVFSWQNSKIDCFKYRNVSFNLSFTSWYLIQLHLRIIDKKTSFQDVAIGGKGALTEGHSVPVWPLTKHYHGGRGNVPISWRFLYHQKSALSSLQHSVFSVYLVVYKFNFLSAHWLCKHSLWSLLKYFWIYKRNDCYEMFFFVHQTSSQNVKNLTWEINAFWNQPKNVTDILFSHTKKIRA